MQKTKYKIALLFSLFVIFTIGSMALTIQYAYEKGLLLGSRYGQIHGQVKLLEELYNEFDVQMPEKYVSKDISVIKKVKYVTIMRYDKDGQRKLIIDSAFF